MFSRKNLLLAICVFICTISVINFRVSAAPATQRIGGTDRYDTALKVSQNNWQQSNYVVLVSGENFPDALCAAPLATKYKAPILLTQYKNLDNNVVNEIKRLGTKNIIIVGGSGVISSDIENVLKNMGIVTNRIYGSDRYGTSAEVAKKIGTSNGIALASGENFPDALSIASIAASRQIPILLTESKVLPDSTKQFLNNNSGSKCYVIGGTGAVSDNVVNGLSNYKRLSGSDRYETNTAVIKEFWDNISFNTVYVANGEGFADALSGSVAAAKSYSPIVLVHNSYGSQQPLVHSYLQYISSIIVLGGTGVVPDSIVQKLMNGSIVITIDPGHGGYDSGAVGPSGVLEKDVNLAISLKVGSILQQNGIDVVYTRTSDNVSWPSEVGQDLQTRIDISNNAGAQYFVCIHSNSADDPSAKGTETYYKDGNAESEKLAQAIHSELVNSTGLMDRDIKTANFYVLRNNDIPSVLVEVGFISNPTEEALLNNDSFQNKAAEAIATGILKTVK